MRKAIAGIALAAAATIPACGESAPCDVEFGPWYSGGFDGPRSWVGMPDLDMLVGDVVETPLVDHFRPTGCFESALEDYGDSLFVVRSADPAAVAVSHSGGVLTTAAMADADSVLVTVAVFYHQNGDFGPDHLDYRHEFHVSVTEATPPR